MGLPQLPEEIAAALPDGYAVRPLPFGTEFWSVSCPAAGWGVVVTGADGILPRIRAHIAAGQPKTRERLTRAQALEKAVREEAARGDRLDDIARRHMLDVQGVLQILGRARARPQFTESTTSRIGKPPMRGRTARGTIHFKTDGE